MPEQLSVRSGASDDVPALLEMLDEAVAWLVARGRAGQWGERPWSARPETCAEIERIARLPGFVVAAEDGALVGALVVDEKAPPYAPPADEPELYVLLLLTSRRHAGRGIGAVLLSQAAALARDAAKQRLRLDCWAGGDGALIAYYRRQGFTPTEEVSVHGWPAQILVRPLSAPPAPPAGAGGRTG